MKFVTRRACSVSRLLALLSPAILLLAPGARGQATATLTTLHRFSDLVVSSVLGVNNTNSDGAFPGGLIQGRDGNFYGITQTGGTGASGTVFRITPAGVLTTLYSFTGFAGFTLFNNDGVQPTGVIQGRDGNFYGTTADGGTGGSGTVFQIAPDGKLTTLHAFGPPSANAFTNVDGASPAALLQGGDGNFYGRTNSLGPTGKGTIFQMAPTGELTTLHSFVNTGDDPGNGGAFIEGNDGNFYGVRPSSEDGYFYNSAIFRVTPEGKLANIYNFNMEHGDNGFVTSLIQGSDGSFYGTEAEAFAAYTELIFKLSPQGALTVLHRFPDRSNHHPGSLTQGRDGKFYGVNTGKSAIYRITAAGGYTILYLFSAVDSVGHNVDGAGPAALIQGNDGSFYGTTREGGANGTGTVFKLTVTEPPPAIVTVTTLGDGTAVEGGENGKVAVRREGDTSEELTVSYKVKGFAKPGVDYEVVSGFVTIPPGATQAKIKIKPIDHPAKDGSRNAKVKLLPSTNGSYELGGATLAKVKIIDHD